MHIPKSWKKLPLIRQLAHCAEDTRKKIDFKRKLRGRYKFADRSKGKEKLCIVLAGYKPYLYSAVFGRLKKYLPNDIDMCVVTSGLYSDEISKLCEENHWSYLSTQENSVSLIQNIAIHLHPLAQYIYKLDEDIFVAQNYFETMYNDYLDIEKNSSYNIGFLAPLIPINGYGHVRILEKLNLTNEYESKFEKPKVAADRGRMIENSPDVAEFFWGKGGYVPTIDALNRKFMSQELDYAPCPVRFSIGAILFTRKTFEDMGMYEIPKTGNLGGDEKQLCSYCFNSSKAIIVVENVVVGHLAFKKQNDSMKKYFEENRPLFEIE